ncbi:hypothetical protein SRABI96_00092 [Peribacillus sp. Bi96]|nr:hypothetical protein SRABI96_00092 [Peribacillus sp. Bi96]
METMEAAKKLEKHMNGEIAHQGLVNLYER